MKKILITVILTFLIITSVALADYMINKDFMVVKTMSVKKENIKRYIKATGEAEEQNKREINVDLPFKVEEIFIEVGDEIKKDQKLFKIDKEALKNKIEIQNYTNSENYENIIAKIENHNTYITSPINGVITKINIKNGMDININSPTVVISDLDNLIVKAQVPESLVSDIYVGQAVILKGKSFDGEEKGKVVKIYPVYEKTGEKNIQTFVTVDIIAESYEKIKPKATLDIEFEKVNNNTSLVIPFDSVMFDEEEPYVYIERYGYAVKRYVNLGEEYETNVEILSGISTNDKLILNPKSQNIENGAKLSIID